MIISINGIHIHVHQDDDELDLSGDWGHVRAFQRIFKSDDIYLVCRFLNDNPSFTVLSVNYSNFGDEGAKAIAANTTITTLNAHCSEIGVEGAKALALNTTLTTLDIGGNKIGDEGAIALAANTTLKMLNVSLNNIGVSGAKALADNTTLKTLDISCNNIGAVGARALAANTSIKSLDIRGKYVEDLGDKYFVSAIKNNITVVKLSHNIVNKIANQTIKKVLARNKKMPEIIRAWMLTNRHARLMAQAQRSENCPLGTLPLEVLGLINDYAVGVNQFSFFISQFNKRPTAEDLIVIKKMALS